MGFTIYFVFLALLCAVRANPLPTTAISEFSYPTTTVCESNTPNYFPYLPLPMPSGGMVRETAPNLGRGYGYPLPKNMLPWGFFSCPGVYPYQSHPISNAGNTISETMPNIPPVSSSMVGVFPAQGVGTTTMYENIPNVSVGATLPISSSAGSTTLYESVPNSPAPGFINYPMSASSTVSESIPNFAPASQTICKNVPVTASTTIHENIPNICPSIYPKPNNPIGGAFGGNVSPSLLGIYPYSNAGSTVCESSSNVIPFNGVPIPLPGLFPACGPIGLPYL